MRANDEPIRVAGWNMRTNDEPVRLAGWNMRAFFDLLT